MFLSMSSLFSLLCTQHREMRALFTRLEATSDNARAVRKKWFQRLAIELVSHAHAEERVLYNTLKEYPAEQTNSLEMIEEHRLAEREVAAITAVDVREERWIVMIKVLRETTEHHFEEEEDKIFPVARRMYTRAEQGNLAKEFLRVQREIKKKRQQL